MQIEKDRAVSLFVPHRTAIEALGLSLAELAQRGYPRDSDDAGPATPIETTRYRQFLGPVSVRSRKV
jgi:hypothetical protein